MGEFEGRVEGHRDGHGFVIPDNGDPSIYLAPQEMRSVLHKDRVRVRVQRYDRKGRPEGRVIDIIERRKTPIIGRLLHENSVWLVAPEDRRYGQDILIPKNATANAAVGQVVAIELTETPSMFSQPVGRITEVLGEIDDPGMEIEIAVRKYEVPHRFSPETLAQAAGLPDKLRPVDKKARIDLTDVPLVTIDGEDARDFDDAVYCEPLKKGRGKTAFEGWRLIVAIADVTSARNSSTSCTSAVSPAAMALETGWSERLAKLAANAATCSLSAEGAMTTNATSFGLPSVTVPVLSRAITFRLRASSK